MANGFDAWIKGNPICDECGNPTGPRRGIGPFLCDPCRDAVRKRIERVANRERTVHIVKLPEGMKKAE